MVVGTATSTVTVGPVSVTETISGTWWFVSFFVPFKLSLTQKFLESRLTV